MSQVEFIDAAGRVETISLKGIQTKPFKAYGGLTIKPDAESGVELTLVARGKITRNGDNELTVQEYEPEKPKTWVGRLKQKYFDPRFDGIGVLQGERVIYTFSLSELAPDISVRYERCEDRKFTVRLSPKTADTK